MINERRMNFQAIAAFILIIVGCGLLIAGFIVNPLGVIDPSVLTAFGETSTFAGAIFGIEYTYKYRSLKKKKEENPDKDN